MLLSYIIHTYSVRQRAGRKGFWKEQ